MKSWRWCTLVTLGLILSLFIPIWATPRSNPLILHVPGIPGPYCAYGVEKRLLELEEVRQVSISWDNEALIIFLKEGAELSPGRIDKVIRKADYPYRYSIQQ